jgi:hypothetical protein
MNTQWSKHLVVVAALGMLAAFAAEAAAQISNYLPAAPSQATQALSGDQVSAAKSALCSAVASHFSNPAAAGPSALTDPSVMSTAASSFAGSSNLSVASATTMLKGYVAQHSTDILASCATSSATNGLPSKIPGVSGLPAIPKMP